MFKKENLVKYIVGIVVSVAFLSAFIIYNLSSKVSNQEVLSLGESLHNNENGAMSELNEYGLFEDIPDENIFVEIKGEVLNPDVYEVKKGSIVKDLIVMSGGLTSDGDISNINQARELQSGECIIVYSKQEILEAKDLVEDIYAFSDHSNVSNKESLVNINTASKDELKKLNGIGDGIAESIISYREENGKFENIDDIKNVSRIGDKTFEKFKEKIKV